MSTKVCPECGSAHIFGGDEIIILANNETTRDARCLQCKWEGKRTDLLTIPDALVDKHMEEGGLVSPDRGIKLAAKMSEDLLARLAKNAGQAVGLSLVQAGFVGLKDSKRLGRLIKAACLGALGGVMGEMELIQTEEQGGRPKITE